MRIKGEVWSYRRNQIFIGGLVEKWDGVSRMTVETPLGYVLVWVWHSNLRQVRFEVIHGGREYLLQKKGGFSKRGLGTMAHRFIKDVQEGIHG